MTTLCHGPLLVPRWFASPFFSHRIRCCAATSDHAGKSCTLWSTSACAVSRSVTDLPVAVDDVVDPKEQGFLAAGGPIGTPEFIKAHVQLRGACRHALALGLGQRDAARQAATADLRRQAAASLTEHTMFSSL